MSTYWTREEREAVSKKLSYGNLSPATTDRWTRILATVDALEKTLRKQTDAMSRLRFTVRDAINAGLPNINPYAMNEGLATGDEEYDATEDARLLLAALEGK